MRGETVIVRCHGGAHEVGRVWSVGTRAVAVCSEEVFQRLSIGDESLRPVEVQVDDVFEFDPSWEPRFNHREFPDWSLLKPWQAGKRNNARRPRKQRAS